MGVHNRITESKYKQIKAVLKVPADDKKAMKKFGVGATTCRNIRLTKNYLEYSMRVSKSHKRMIIVPSRAISKVPRTRFDTQDGTSRMIGLTTALAGLILVLVVFVLAVLFSMWFFGGAK